MNETASGTSATSTMARESVTTINALQFLHFTEPVLVLVYFFAARTIATCYLHTPSRNADKPLRRYLALGGTPIIVASYITQAVPYIIQATSTHVQNPSQDEVIYVALGTFASLLITVNIADNKALVWHPHLGSWLISLVYEIPIFALQLKFWLLHSVTLFVLHIVRLVALTILVVSGSVYALLDRRTGAIKLDDESESLLTNGYAEHDSSKPRQNGTYGAVPTSEDSNDDDFSDIDSDSEDPEADHKLKAEQRQRLKESGSWLNYMRDFKIFIPMLWPSKDRLVQVCILAVLLVLLAERVFLVLIPQQIGYVTDELAANQGKGVMPWKHLGLWMLFYWLDSNAGLVYIKDLSQLRIQWFAYKSIGATSFRHIMEQSMDFHNNKNSGELIRAIEQGHNLQDMLDFIFFDIGPTFIDLGVSLVYVYTLFDIYVSLMLLVVGVSYIWVAAKVTKWSIPSRRQLNAAQRNETKVQNEAISNWQTVSHFNQSEYECERYDKTLEDFIRAEWIYYFLFYTGGSIENAILLLGRFASHSYAAWLVVQGIVPVGRFVTLTVYWGSVARPLAELSWSIRRVSQMFTDSERLLQLLMTKPTVIDAPDARELVVTDGAVSFSDVTFTYDPRNPTPTLRNLSFAAKPGQTIALVGETGGGKSTVLKLLYRYYDIQSGNITIDGQDIRSVTQNSLRDAFGMVPQDPALFNGTILENVRYARLDATDAEVESACRAACIHDKILTFPDGYATTVGERGVKLSGGELQRIAIARAVLRKPKIVLLDEATSAIDAHTETQIQMALKELTRGRTTFVIAHRLSTIQHADVILVVQKGEVVERGTHEELMARDYGRYRNLWSRQLSRGNVERVEGDLT